MATASRTAGTLTQLTATGNTGVIAVDTDLALLCSIEHNNGTGTITAAATIQPQVSHDGTNWFDYGGAFTCDTTASSQQFFTFAVDLPLPGNDVRFSYTAPTGSTGHTLDVAFTRTTAIA